MIPNEMYWRAPDFRKSWRRSALHSLSLFIAFVLGIVAFNQRNIPFFIIVVAVEFFVLLGTRGTKRTMVVAYALTPEGFSVEEEIVYYKNEVTRFAMVEHQSQDVNPWFEMIMVSDGGRPARRRLLVPHEQGFLIREFLTQKWGINEFDYNAGGLEFFKRLMGK